MGRSNFKWIYAKYGAKQGGILSLSMLRLFNVYIDDVIKEPNSSRIGGNVGGNLINHLCYADDLTLINLHVCSAGMEKLLAICNKYGIKQELV